MELNVAFGKDGLILNLPDSYAYRVLDAKSAAPLANEAEALGDALDAPIGCASLRELAHGKKTAAISICDITRPAPNSVTLPPLLGRLQDAGIAATNITILIATGLHRPATEDEVLRIVGPEIASRYRIINHHAKELSEHRFLGVTSRGTPVHIDERFMAADLHITLGFIEQHLMLGFSGGRKLIAPGLAAQETIKVLHSPKFMREPKAIEGSVADNPLHQELLEIARMARHDFILDTALTRTREIAGVFAGDPVQAHAAGVRFVSEALLERLPEPADAVLTTAAGYPLDLTFYQAIKGVTAAQHILKPGGRILLVAECAEGAGAPEFAEKLREFDSYRQLLEQIWRAPVVVDQWQIEKLALAGEKYDIFFYVPGLPENLRVGLGGRAYNRPEQAVAAFLNGLPAYANVAVIPEGPYVYARVEEPVLA